MRDEPKTHFFTGRGALCGVSVGSRWSLVESRTTCPECRDLLKDRERHGPAQKKRTAVGLGRLRGGP
jgi:rubredoxin